MNVFGQLKYESGVHRVQRVPVTGTKSDRLQTSTCSVAILPKKRDLDMNIPEKERILFIVARILYQNEFDEMMGKLSSSRKLQIGNMNRNEKIRTYNFSRHMVTEHRLKISKTFPNIVAFMSGDYGFENHEVNGDANNEVTEKELNSWLRTPPELTIVRVNTKKNSVKEAKFLLENHLGKDCDNFGIEELNGAPEVLTVRSKVGFKNQITPLDHEVIVDEYCGVAVLRGANVFAPGILSISPGTAQGDQVSVYVDLDHKCLRGYAKMYTGNKVHVGNGVLQVSRDEVFRDNIRGNGVIMTQRLYNCPSIDEGCELSGQVMLQNLPSILAVMELDPQPGHRVLDMCAAPGGKTMHIAARMCCSGTVIALDKSAAKIGQITKNRDAHGFTNLVRAYACDSRKSVIIAETNLQNNENKADPLSGPPPYPSGQFERVLLDAPCSALGQRPQFHNRLRPKELDSFPRVQRKLFQTAVDHLAPGGILVYSTCTLNFQENQGIVEWAADQPFSSRIQPIPVKEWNIHPQLIPGASSSPDLNVNYLIFGHPNTTNIVHDTIGFFIAKYRKIC